MLRCVVRRLMAMPAGLIVFGALVAAGCGQSPQPTATGDTGSTETAGSARTEPDAGATRRILVYGATGQQGRVAARLLRKAGFSVRGTSRHLDGDTAKALADDGIEMVYSDVEDAASIDAAVSGIDGLYLIVPSSRGRGDLNFAKAIIGPAQRAGVGHLVYLSYLSADPVKGWYKAPKQLTENYIRSAQSIPYTMIRSVEFMENFNALWKDRILADGVADPKGADFMRQFIAAQDLAAFAVRAFENPAQWKGRSINVAGDQMTNVELAAMLSRVVGREVPYRKISWEQWETDYQIPRPIVEIWRWYSESRLVVDVDALRVRYPGMQRLEGFLREGGWENYP